jgi:hypothetical protein
MLLRHFVFNGIMLFCGAIHFSIAETSADQTTTVDGAASGSSTPIYRETGKSGTPVFTDQPTPSAKPVELAPVNTSEQLQNMPAPRSEPAAAESYRIQLTSPTSTTVIENSLAGVPVSVNVSPKLAKGMTVEILLDGRSAQQGANTSFNLIGVNSGTHTIQALLKRGDKIIARSASISFQAIRPGG